MFDTYDIRIPNHLQAIPEIVEINRLTDIQMRKLEEDMEELQDNLLISTSRESGITRREQILKIVPRDTDTLEERRFRVSVNWYDSYPYTEKNIYEKMDRLCGAGNYEAELNKNENLFLVKFQTLTKREIEEMRNLLEEIVSLNVVLRFERVIIFDSAIRTDQDISVKSIDLHMRLPFWDFRTFDGTWQFDGETFLDAERSYRVPVGLLYDMGAADNENTWNAPFISIRTGTKTEEEFHAEAGMAGGTVDFWQSITFNGEKKLDGSWEFEDRKRQKCSHGTMDVSCEINTASGNFDGEAVAKRNLWHLDGTVPLSGTKTLDALMKKEAI